jgi:hypothetical protein
MGNLEDNSDKPVTHGDVRSFIWFLLWMWSVYFLPIVGVPYGIYWVIKRVIHFFSLEQRYERNPDLHYEEMQHRWDAETATTLARGFGGLVLTICGTSPIAIQLAIKRFARILQGRQALN